MSEQRRPDIVVGIDVGQTCSVSYLLLRHTISVSN